MEMITSGQEMTRWVEQARAVGLRVGFVPTMGALHAGHLTLVRQALAECDRVVVSIFVNPTQFGPREDFSRYPREFARDAGMLREAGCHALFAPEVGEIYPEGPGTLVRVEGISEELCGHFRPGHFQGVATVVAILFHLVPADRAYFGLKDYQQFLVIRRMARELRFPVAVIGVATVREADGLAMSSRNRYLAPEERQRAATLSRLLREAAAAVVAGEDDPVRLEEQARRGLLAAGIDRIDYVAVRDGATLAALDKVVVGAVMLMAVHVGGARLIDNMILRSS